MQSMPLHTIYNYQLSGQDEMDLIGFHAVSNESLIDLCCPFLGLFEKCAVMFLSSLKGTGEKKSWENGEREMWEDMKKTEEERRHTVPSSPLPWPTAPANRWLPWVWPDADKASNDFTVCSHHGDERIISNSCQCTATELICTCLAHSGSFGSISEWTFLGPSL